MAHISKFRSLPRTDVAEQLDVTWDEFLGHLAAEPTEQFTGQMEHGGWSPVVYDPPRRLKDNVKQVGALVLDYDKGGSWERIHGLWARNYGLVYTTKSHGAPDAIGDRLRVVLPLERGVTAEEYARIWDWAARASSDVGCPADPQTKDASRFWYDPTKPPGGWRAVKLDGKAIDPDAILALVAAEPPPKLRIVQPPPILSTDFRVERARRYLARIPGAVSGDSGHTQTFNAVAHVMIGFDLDPDLTEQIIASDYNPKCDPPWSERELRHKIQSVARQCQRPRGYLLNERPRIDSTPDAAHHAPAAPAELSVDWISLLLVKKDRSPRRAYHNTLVFVRHHPDYRGKWALDTMTATPWFDGAPVRESFIHDIRASADAKLGYTPSTQDVEAAIATAAEDRPFHPILQYLRSLDWDGTSRLDSLARDYLGSDDPTHAIMLRKFMIGAAARALWPGCKHDTALMLVGDQGVGKSTFFSTLGGSWHADSFVDITNKDSFVQIHSAWIYELAELENVVTGRAESRLKAWLTSTHDMYRAPYQRTAQRRARAVVICGTTNRPRFLTDETGSRRFWIVPVKQSIDRDMLAHARDQLWAEALCAAEGGEPWWLDDENERLREASSSNFQEEDVWSDLIADWISPVAKEITVADILRDALKIDPGRQDRWAQMRVARALTQLGWERIRESRPPRRWKYVKTVTQTEVQW